MSEKKKVFTHVPYPMLLERLQDVVAMGINPEIYIDGGSLDTIKSEDVLSVGRALRENSLECTVHGPFMGLFPGAPDERVRRTTIERYIETLEAVRSLKPVRVVLHASYDDRYFDGDVALWLANSVKTWPEVLKVAKSVGTTIAVENVFETEPAPLKKLIDEVDASNFGVCIDAGHLNIFAKTPMIEWFKALGRHILSVHIHDNRGSMDEHLPVGQGNIDFDLFFSLLKTHSKDAVYTIEPHGEGALKAGLAAVDKYL